MLVLPAYLEHFLWKYIGMDASKLEPTLVQVMTWGHQATSHYQSKCRSRSALLQRVNWVVMFKSSSDTHYVLKSHQDPSHLKLLISLVLCTGWGSIWARSTTVPNRADPVVVFPLCWWCSEPLPSPYYVQQTIQTPKWFLYFIAKIKQKSALYLIKSLSILIHLYNYHKW